MYKLLPMFVCAMIMALTVFAPLAAGSREAQAIDILQRAQRAHESGNAGHALALIKQARRIWPALSEPAWFSQRKAAEITAQTVPNVHILGRDALVSRFLRRPDRANVALIEKYLEKSPEDHELRRLIVDYALKQGDTELVAKHFPFIPSKRFQANYFDNKLKYILLLALVVAIIWQANALMKDIKLKPREEK